MRNTPTIFSRTLYTAFAIGTGMLLSWQQALAATIIVPNGAGDDTAAIQAAVQSANAGDTIQLESGEYEISSLAAGGFLFDLEDKSGLTIRGAANNATVLMIYDNESTVFGLENSSNITIEDFRVRRADLPFSQGIVDAHPITLSSTQGRIEVKVQGFDKFDLPKFTSLADLSGNFTDPSHKKRVKANTGQDYKVTNVSCTGNASASDPNAVSICTVDLALIAGKFITLDEVAKNDGFILRTKRDAHVVRVWNSTDITLSRIASSESPGSLITGRGNENITIANWVSEVQGDQWTSGTAGGINLGDTKGPVNITDNNFDALGDDNVNLHGRSMFIGSGSGGTTIYYNKLQAKVATGDSVLIFRPQDGEIIVDPVVATVDTEYEHPNNPTKWGLLRLPAGTSYVRQAGDLLFNESRAANGFEIKRNIFTNGRRNGMMIRGNDGTIEDNVMDYLGLKGITTEGVWVQEAGHWRITEGFRLKGTVIIGNNIKNPSLAALRQANKPATILVTARRADGNPATGRINERNTLQANILWTYQGAIVRLHAAKDTTVKKTNISTSSGDFLREPPAYGNHTNYLFELINAGNTRFLDNKLSLDTRNHDGCILVDTLNNEYLSDYTLSGNTSPPACTME